MPQKTNPKLPYKQPECGFTTLELILVMTVSIILVAFAIPKYVTIRNTLRAAGDIRGIADVTAQAKLRAAADFTHARVYADLSNNAFQEQVWYKAGNSGAGCWVADYDSSNTCLTFTGSAPSGTVINLSQGDTFGYGSLSSGPTPGQSTIGQSAQCLDNSGTTIANTACIVFNSRGVPINASTLAPVSSDAIYLGNGTLVYGVTVSAPALIQTWSTAGGASPTWSAL